jgi:hypothetical protein
MRKNQIEIRNKVIKPKLKSRKDFQLLANDQDEKIQQFDFSFITLRALNSYFGLPVLLRYPQLLKNQLRKHFEFIEKDDQILLRDDSIDKLELEQLKESLFERGM